MAKAKSVYVCQSCGNDSPKWKGKCPACGEWNTYVEEVLVKETRQQVQLSGFEIAKSKPVLISEIETAEEVRIETPFGRADPGPRWRTGSRFAGAYWRRAGYR